MSRKDKRAAKRRHTQAANVAAKKKAAEEAAQEKIRAAALQRRRHRLNIERMEQGFRPVGWLSAAERERRTAALQAAQAAT